jgi:hypothetical protein
LLRSCEENDYLAKTPRALKERKEEGLCFLGAIGVLAREMILPFQFFTASDARGSDSEPLP